MDCKHENFEAHVEVNRLEDIGRFAADVRITCMDCGTPFGFLGLPTGLDLDGATVSVDGAEAHLALLPIGKPLPVVEGVTGFRIVGRKVGD